MRVAVCLTGQFRTAKQCKDNIVNTFTVNRPANIEVDFFAHTWDYSKTLLQGSEEEQKSKEIVERELVTYFHPKAFLVETMPEKFKQGDGWRMGQFYSISQSFRLRREYEKQESIRYDFVFFCRFDHFRMEETEESLRDRYVIWDKLPKTSNCPTLYDWYSTFQWEHWLVDRPGHWIIHDFSWFCNGLAADLLEGLYDMYEELCSNYRTPNTYSRFWTDNSLFLIPEKYLGLYCYVSDIKLEEDKGAYSPGCPIREGLESVDLYCVEGRKFLQKLLRKYGFGYTKEIVQQELQNLSLAERSRVIRGNVKIYDASNLI